MKKKSNDHSSQDFLKIKKRKIQKMADNYARFSYKKKILEILNGLRSRILLNTHQTGTFFELERKQRGTENFSPINTKNLEVYLKTGH